MPTNLMSMLNPFGTDENSKSPPDATSNAEETTNTTPSKKRSTLSSWLGDAVPAGPPSPSKSDADVSIMFAEPESQGTSDAGSREGSIDGRRRSKKINRPKTQFSICHPPPASSTRQKLHRRPRSLMQLHKLSPGARPVPAYEIIPSANFSVRLTKAITKVFRAKHGLCPNDLVVLSAEKYSIEEIDEEQEARHVLGLICKGRKEDAATAGKAKICLAGGREWEACSLMNGGYEFFSTDEHGLGLTVRWVPKRAKDGSKDRKRFNFSTISPNSRKHPIIACLQKTSLDINDTYKMPEPSAVTPLSTPNQRGSILEDAIDEDALKQDACVTTDELRQVITLTGIWVAFKEGWSPSIKYDDANGLQRSASVHNSPNKGAASPINTPPGSPTPGAIDRRVSVKSVSSSILRRSSMLSRGNRNSTISNASSDELPQQSASVKKTGRSRGDSTSTVLVHRAASNRRKNNQQATWRPDMLSAQHQLTETSREDLYRTPPRRQLSTIDSPAGGEDETTPQPSRKPSVARPIIPPTESSEQNHRSRLPDRPASVDKRESSTTTGTSTSEQGGKMPPQKAPTKAKRGWRRILCGSSDI